MITAFKAPPAQLCSDVHIRVFATQLGWIGVAHQRSVVHGLVFGHATRERAERAIRKLERRRADDSRVSLIAMSTSTSVCDDVADAEFIADLQDRLQFYAAGHVVDFSEFTVANSQQRTFGRRVMAACRKIPYGQTCSYGDLAATCGSPKAARAVGHVMATNRFPLIVPCHRVVGSGGSLGGYSAPGGLRTKRKLLDLEANGNCASR